MSLLSGKGYFMWKAINCNAGRPQEIAAAAYAADLGHVLIKIADGVLGYNQSVNVPAIVEALQAYGIEVWGWQYIYGQSPSVEAQVAIREILRTGVTGFVVNAEREFKAPGMATAAIAYMSALRSGVSDLPIALSTYRFPSLHPQFPYAAFLARCNLAMPQVYWLYSHDPVQQLTRSLAEYRRLTSLPIIPTGAAWKQNGWQSTPADCNAFLQAAQSAGLPAANFWSWDASQNLPTWDAIAAYDWPPEPAPLPPSPPEPEPEPVPVPVPPIVIPEEDMNIEQIKALQEEFPEAAIIININFSAEVSVPEPEPAPDPEPEPEPTPQPPAPSAYLVRVTADPRANARFTKANNAVGLPIMQIYPSDSSLTSQRIQFTVGDLLPVDPKGLRADGGEDYFKLTGKRGRDGETLYIRDDDCIKTW